MGLSFSTVLRCARYLKRLRYSCARQLYRWTYCSLVALISITVAPSVTAYSDSFTANASRQYSFENLLSSSDLGLGDVRAILQSYDGFMWVGADAGLYRYDGYDFEKIKVAEESKQYISEVRHISKLFEDSQKRIWVGSTVGILELNRETNLLHPIGTEQPQRLYINDIAELQNGKILFASYQGLKIYNPTTQQSTLYTHESGGMQGRLSDNAIFSIWIQNDHNVWLGTRKGLNHFDPTTDTFRSVSINIDSDQNNDLAIHALEPSKDGGLWLGTLDGLIHYNLSNSATQLYRHSADNPASLSSNAVSDVLYDSKKQLWIATDGQGLNLFNPQAGNFSHIKHIAGQVGSLSSNIIRTLFEDGQGDI